MAERSPGLERCLSFILDDYATVKRGIHPLMFIFSQSTHRHIWSFKRNGLEKVLLINRLGFELIEILAAKQIHLLVNQEKFKDILRYGFRIELLFHLKGLFAQIFNRLLQGIQNQEIISIRDVHLFMLHQHAACGHI